MSNAIANKRRLLEATQELVKRTNPDLPEMQAAANALAQVFSDMLGVNVELRMRMDRDELSRVIARQELAALRAGGGE